MTIHELVIDGTPSGERKDLDPSDLPDFIGHPSKSGWQWLPVETEAPEVVATYQELQFSAKSVEADRVVDVYIAVSKESFFHDQFAARVRRDASALEAAGDNIGALLLLHQHGV